ncbi:MAG: DNA repair protein RecN [Micrococcales bacterium]|nr:DNA repair protein RecN [Micrococcales bacterium]
MLQEISIRNLGVIDDAVLELHPGLNVVTGETGAGKTMVVSGLGLLLGSRADAGLVRTGAASAVVEGMVDLPADHPALARAEEAGGDVSDGLILARSVAAGGRSRAHVGGRSAPVSVLAELGEQLVAVHGQADQWRLRRPEEHRDLVDAAGGPRLVAAREAYAACHDQLLAVRDEVERLRALARDRAQEADALQFGLEQIEALAPEAGEDEALRREDGRLSHAEDLRGGAGRAHAALAGADDTVMSDAPSVTGLLAEAQAALAGPAEADPELAALRTRVDELAYLASDVASDLSAYAAAVDLDPERLAWVQERRAALGGLTRKYGESVDEVIEWGRRAALRLDELLGADDRIDALAEQEQTLRVRLGELAGALSTARAKAAAALGKAVTKELGHLAMGKALVQVAVTQRPDPEGLAVPGMAEPVRYTRHGVDDIEIQLAANPGAPARSVTKAASGGELSRVMLALEVVAGAGAGASVPTFVFDEVDAGVGGKAALDVGARLAALAEHAQVLVVTHLPQVAAYADRHLVVEKASDGHVTASGIHLVEGSERESELARMMTGVETDSALEHARELLASAVARRGR